MGLLPDKCDVLVVGAGPAGSMAAKAAAIEGAETVLIDAKPRIGEQPHCAEYVPEQLFHEYSLPIQCVVQRVAVMETLVLDGPWSDEEAVFRTGFPADHGPTVVKSVESRSRGFVIDRVRFDRELARDAAVAGALVLAGGRLVQRGQSGSWRVRLQGDHSEISANYVVAADGARSSVVRGLGLNDGPALAGLQAEVPLFRPLDRTMVFLHRDFRSGYGWVFPKGKFANVGIGLANWGMGVPRGLLMAFVRWLRGREIIGPGALGRWGGLIQVGGMRETLCCDNVLLAGDAAGLTHPITGAGIPQAVISGELAGRAAAAGGEGPAGYAREITGRFGGAISHAWSKRLLMGRLWDEPDFLGTCDRTWIAFPGYRKRERN